MEKKKELDKKYEYFWNNIGIDGIDIGKKIEKVVIAGGFDMKRYKSIYGVWSCDPEHVLLKEDENGEWVKYEEIKDYLCYTCLSVLNDKKVSQGEIIRKVVREELERAEERWYKRIQVRGLDEKI